MTGYVAKLNADIGDVVSAGDVVASIDVPELEKQSQMIQAKLHRLDAEAKRAAAGIQLADAGIQAAEAKVGQAKSDVDRIEADVAASQSEFDRTSELVSRQSVQPKLLDEARSRRDSDIAQRASVVSARRVKARSWESVGSRARASSIEAEKSQNAFKRARILSYSRTCRVFESIQV